MGHSGCPRLVGEVLLLYLFPGLPLHPEQHGVTMRLLARLLTAFAISGLTCALRASADEITYTYTGNQFNNFGGGATCPLECNISGSFTISAPLGSNFDGYFVPNSFSFYRRCRDYHAG
jgi:hypothetical protein